MTQNAPKSITLEESTKLLDWLQNKKCFCTSSRKRYRNYAAGVIMLDTGLRVGELVKLRQSSFLINGEIVNALYVPADITKTHSARTIPLTIRIKEAIAEMNDRWWSEESKYNSCFAFYDTNPAIPITARQVERIIAHASLLSFGRAISPHVLRHTFASRMMRVAPQRVVQELLGHKSLASTQIYTHPNGDDLENAIKAYEG